MDSSGALASRESICLSVVTSLRGAKRRSNPDFFGVVIPGRERNERTMVRNCAPENLEIPGLVLRTIPE